MVDKTHKGKQRDIINKIDYNDSLSIINKISLSMELLEKSIVLNNRDNKNDYENTFDDKNENMTDYSINID